jgi:hypothetical protein
MHVLHAALRPLHAQRRWAFFVLLCTMSSLAALSQSTQSSIFGNVRDGSSAAISKAEIKLIQTEDGSTRTTQTNAVGDYQFQNIKPGHYTLVVEASGFERWSVYGTALAARQQLRLDATLSIGAVAQQITVSGGEVSAIETDSPTISAVYGADDALNLPTNSRASSSGTSGLSLIGTLPGVQTNGGTYSLQGGLPFQTEVQVDGISVQNAANNKPIADAFPSTDAIAELRADGVMNNAEYGQPGEVTVITRSGSNQYHGSTYWYHQNAAFDAIQFGSASKTHKVGNTFGGRFSGPVSIPHLYQGRGRSFVAAGYEGFRFPQQTSSQYIVPTAAMKKGDFTNYTAKNFTSLINPATGAAYSSGNTLPSINSAAAQFLKFFPDPNHGSTTTYTDGQAPNYYVNKSANQHSDQFDIRGDQYFGSNQGVQLWGRYSYKNFPVDSPQTLAVNTSQNTNVNHSLVSSANWTIHPNLVNEGRFGFTLTKTGSVNTFNGKSFTNGLGLNGLENLFYNGLPELDFANMTSLDADRLNSINQSKTYIYADSLTWTPGRHVFKFGADVRTIEAITPLGFNGSDNYGTFGYSNSGNATGQYTGVDFADFLIGIPNNTFYDVVQQDNDGKTKHYHFFAQDQWRVSQRLTVTYGLRYELHPGYNDPSGNTGNFIPTSDGAGEVIYPTGKSSLLSQAFLASANACNPDGVTTTNTATVNGAPCMKVLTNSQAGYPSSLKKVPHLRFLPRVGFAFRPFSDEKTSIRGGFGLYNITMLGSNFYSLTGTLQADTVEYKNTYDKSSHAIGYQWPSIYAGSGSDQNATNYGTAYFGTANDPNWKDPYTEQWSVSVDHDFGSGYAVRASYIGSASHQLVWAPDENTLPFSSTVSAYNQPNSARKYPNWGRIYNRATGANAIYNSMQIEASHRFQHGFQFNSSYTLANAKADNQGPNNTSFAGENGGGRATSILDRHADYGNVVGTRHHLWNTTMVYDLPFGHGKRFGASAPRALDAIVGGWRMSNILTWQSGAFLTPYFPAGQGDPSGTGSGLTSTAAGWTPSKIAQHPDRVAGANWKPAHQNRNNWINASAFTCPGDSSWTPGNACTTGSGSGSVPLPIGRFGNSPVGAVNGPGYFSLNSGIVKAFPITERVHLRAEGTFTNVLNNLNLDGSNLNLNLSNASFGVITSGLAPRQGQVSLRLEF